MKEANNIIIIIIVIIINITIIIISLSTLKKILRKGFNFDTIKQIYGTK